MPDQQARPSIPEVLAVGYARLPDCGDPNSFVTLNGGTFFIDPLEATDKEISASNIIVGLAKPGTQEIFGRWFDTTKTRPAVTIVETGEHVPFVGGDRAKLLATPTRVSRLTGRFAVRVVKLKNQ